MTDFWSAVVVVGVAILAVIGIELYERLWRKRHDRIDNTFEQARKDRIDAANLAAFYAPPKPGPHGFRAQNGRRSAQRHTVSEFKSKVN